MAEEWELISGFTLNLKNINAALTHNEKVVSLWQASDSKKAINQISNNNQIRPRLLTPL